MPPLLWTGFGPFFTCGEAMKVCNIMCFLWPARARISSKEVCWGMPVNVIITHLASIQPLSLPPAKMILDLLDTLTGFFPPICVVPGEFSAISGFCIFFIRPGVGDKFLYLSPPLPFYGANLFGFAVGGGGRRRENFQGESSSRLAWPFQSPSSRQ